MDILSVQATSVTSESAFSTSGRAFSIRKTRLTPLSLEKCMCLKDYLDAQERKQDKSTLETPVDFEDEILDAEVQEMKSISIYSDKEIELDGLLSSDVYDTNTMECHTMSTSTQGLLSGQCGNKHISWFSWPYRISSLSNIHGFQYKLVPWCLRKGFRKLSYIDQDYCLKHDMRSAHWRVLCLPTTLEDNYSSMQSINYSKGDDYASGASSEDVPELVDNDQLKSLLADAERAKLLQKLSEANQHNRYLKRQLLVREDAISEFKSELAVTELEIQALLNMAKEIASYGIPAGSRKVNGKYIQSLLLLQLQGVQEKLKKQIKDVELAQSKEVSLFWSGMAESVQVMGSFDGWSHGEYLSAEYTGSYTRFSTSVMLRPGRYEIKFLVDGEWLLSPDYPTVGEGLMENNLLIVE
ncbi:immunoglobulin E-set [Tanacetum coccineum]